MPKLGRLFLALGLLMQAVPLRAETPALDGEFARQAVPVLAKHCLECHQDDGEAGLNLGTLNGLLTGSAGGPVIVPGKASQSLLMQVLKAGAKPHMPPEGQLTAEEIASLGRWIDSLPAETPVGSPDRQQSDHWAFQPVRRPEIPAVKNPAWLRTPVDAYVLHRLDLAGLQPAPEVERETLLRRVYFDLIGLPPSPEQVQAFCRDDSPDAYERVVEELLASPRYGERWGRHWLDLARYADSSGFHEDVDRPSAWRYRDYVIDSFNGDKPYGRFVQEQLAGDLLPDASTETWIATGFGRNGPSNETNMGNGIFREQYRLDQLDDVVSTTSNVFLGLTLGCARCHDHKYDPLTQRDYYRFVAWFNSAGAKRLVLENFQTSAPSLQASVTKDDQWTPISAQVLTDRGEKIRTTHILWRGDPRNQGPAVEPGVPAVIEKQQTDAPQTSRLALADWLTDAENPLTWRVMANRLWAHHFGRGLVATPSNFGKIGEQPTHPELLDWLAAELRDNGGSLKTLHRLLVTSATYRQGSRLPPGSEACQQLDPDNRLLWRMNKRRLEAEPLRDAFLAVAGLLNPQMGGPGIKPRVRPELLNASQRNKWPVVKQEGPEHWRRSVYIYVKRQLQYPLMELFDAPTTTHSCASRSESLVPTQSLLLMNDESIREQAGCFADRVLREAGSTPHDRAELALWIALCRQPESARVQEAADFLAAQTALLIEEGQPADKATRTALADFCHVLMNLSEFVYVD